MNTKLLFRLSYFAIFLLGFLLFLNTLAPSIVFGDPTEYTLVPSVWGIVHPPGYAFMTLLVKLWQTIVPIGSLAYRTNLLSAFAGALTGVMVFRAIYSFTPHSSSSWVAGAIGSFSLYTATNFWQHSLHTNAHIVTALLASTAITLLLIWRETKNDKWLYAFGLVAGFSVTHHPLLVLGFPVYAAFILINRPRWRSLLIMSACGLGGLVPWLYFPLRSFIQPPPPFGPTDLNTFDGFLNLALARGLTNVNLFHFGLDEQWHRLIVFTSLLQLQYAILIIVLAVLGALRLAKKDWKVFTLLSLHLITNLLFTLNSVQDVMAYLLVPLMTISIFIGAGGLGLSEWLPGLVDWWWQRQPKPNDRDSQRRAEELQQTTKHYAQWSVALFLLFPLVNALYLTPLISLRELRTADQYVDSVFEHFAGQHRGTLLLADWEHSTVLWYHQYVNGRALDPQDVKLVYVNKPIVDAIWENINYGPLYLQEYDPKVIATGFRLRAEGNFYKVMSPPATQNIQPQKTVSQKFGAIELIGYDVLRSAARGGETIPIILYFRANQTTQEIIHPFAHLGAWETRFTTDSRLLTPQWQEKEIIAERWEVRVPFNAPVGDYTLRVGIANLTTDADYPEQIELGTVRVTAKSEPIIGKIAANFEQRVAIEAATAWAGGSPEVNAPWATPLKARAGDPLELRLRWRTLQSPETSYTVFVHLNEAGSHAVIVSKDYTPLGGAFPTMLWFPKWIVGQRVTDPYRLLIPRDAQGEYYLEVGLYGLRSVQRASVLDEDGLLAGDRFVLGSILVEP